jgi:hypothetical protein
MNAGRSNKSKGGPKTLDSCKSRFSYVSVMMIMATREVPLSWRVSKGTNDRPLRLWVAQLNKTYYDPLEFLRKLSGFAWNFEKGQPIATPQQWRDLVASPVSNRARKFVTIASARSPLGT